MLGWPYKSVFLLMLVVLGCSGEQHENKLLGTCSSQWELPEGCFDRYRWSRLAASENRRREWENALFEGNAGTGC